MGDPRSFRSAYVGQFEHATANAIAEALEKAGIGWHYKQSGGIAKWFFVGEWGVRLFADATRIDEVQTIVQRVIAEQGES